ncbi:hypothetical protein BpHYR1_019620 [Brachionus plicatilis]|uniref:Uncharacterized protein n=1 Tax=Brachionus plicatilis TaxID=10195 RepID=A0A3M7QE63_BRAPC|nr:hypothetical protein BpHYR1_019620 [Brachionus plicatilis]
MFICTELMLLLNKRNKNIKEILENKINSNTLEFLHFLGLMMSIHLSLLNQFPIRGLFHRKITKIKVLVVKLDKLIKQDKNYITSLAFIHLANITLLCSTTFSRPFVLGPFQQKLYLSSFPKIQKTIFALLNYKHILKKVFIDLAIIGKEMSHFLSYRSSFNLYLRMMWAILMILASRLSADELSYSVAKTIKKRTLFIIKSFGNLKGKKIKQDILLQKKYKIKI